MLGIVVDEDLLHRWRSWLMPERQPFLVPRAVAVEHGFEDARSSLIMELRDSFELYRIADDQSLVVLTRQESRRLDPRHRHDQPTPHRWPTRDVGRDLDRVVAYVERGRRPSRHAQLGDHWTTVDRVLPGARALAGTPARRSGPNCFGTVMGAAGVAGAAEQWMQREPFEAWLAEHTRPGGRDDDLGTVLVWRDADGQVAHAAVTLGRGWFLHKPSQGWMSPTKVLTVTEGKLSSRAAGLRLTRRRLSTADV